MKLVVEETHLSGIAKVKAECGNESIVFSVDTYKSASIPYANELFDDVNRLLSTFSADTQKAIYSVYADIHDHFETIRDPRTLHPTVKKEVIKLYDLIPYQSVRDYVYNTPTIAFPNYLKVDYTDTDRETRDFVNRTYLRDDYVDLVVLAMGFRFMVPIWGVHVGLISDMTDNAFKEYQAYDLIKRSAIFKWPPRQRLDIFIEASHDPSKLGLAATLAQLGGDEIPAHLQALAVIRKLSLAPLSFQSRTDDLVKIIFNFAFGNGHYNRYENNFDGRVRAKIDDEKIVDDEDNSSVWDNFKRNVEISALDKQVVVTYTNDSHRMARHIDSTIDLEKVDLCLDIAMQNVNTFETEVFQTTMTQWICAKLFSPQILSDDDDFPPHAMMRCVAVTQAVLWHWGFLEAAVLMQSTKINGDFVNMDLRSAITRDLSRQLDSLFPHSKLEGRGTSGQKKNPVTKAIYRLCDSILRHEWEPGGPTQLMEDYYKETGSRFWTVPGTIKSQFAEIVIRLSQ